MSCVPNFNFEAGGSAYIEGDVRVLFENKHLVIQARLTKANLGELHKIAKEIRNCEFLTHERLKAIESRRLETKPILIDQQQYFAHQLRAPAHAIIRLLQKVS
jgi:hypothetical protein